MTKTNFILTTVILTSISLIGCNKDESDVIFDVQMLNGQNEPTQTFNQGDEIVFSFQIDNTTNQDIVWYNWCKLFDTPVYTVYHLTENDQGFEEYLLIGKPYSEPVLCPDEPLLINEGVHYYFKTKWSDNNSNASLTPGQYKVEFERTFEFNGQVISKTFKQNFAVN